MKKILLALLLSAFVFGAKAQTRTITVFCQITANGAETYLNAKVFPDSVKNAVFINYRKLHNLRSEEEAMQWMSMDGWKLASVTTQNGGVIANYFVTREITVSESQFQQLTVKLEALHK
jgi:hypothetical protein